MSSPDPTGTGAPPEPTTQPGQVPPAGLTNEPTTDAEIEKLRKENAKWRTQLRDTQSELEKIRTSTLPDAEKAVAEAKAAGAAEYQSKWRTAVLDNAALTVLAEKRITATELALRALDLSDVDVDPTTGKVDQNALAAKVDALIQRYPMLAPDAPLPGIGSLSGADQRRIQASQLAKPGENERDALNRLARYALGSGE